MEEVEATREAAAKKAGQFLVAEIDQQGEKVLLKKQRTLEILEENNRFICTLELDISFDHFQDNGSACNKAEIFLLPEEFPAFAFALSEHRISFPTVYRQWREANPNIIRVCMESIEPPEEFAARLSPAMYVLE
ncbi:MAG: DUF1259 domain-containing protein [Planococcus donghaensis]